MSNMYCKLIEPRFNEIRSAIAGGETEAAVAGRLGISPDSWRKYRNEYPKFNELIIEALQVADGSVESALFRRATGFETAEGKTVPPDVRAAVFWLKNRRPAQWKDRQHVEVDGPIPVKLTAEENNL